MKLYIYIYKRIYLYILLLFISNEKTWIFNLIAFSYTVIDINFTIKRIIDKHWLSDLRFN